MQPPTTVSCVCSTFLSLMSRLSEIRVVEDEVRPKDWRIRKVHGVWCIQHLEHHTYNADAGGATESLTAWAFVKGFNTHPEAVKWFDTFLHYDPAHHHLEPCS